MLTRIASNHGDYDSNAWGNSINADGTLKPRPIYARSNTGASIGLDLEDIDALVKARDELLAVQAEVQAELAKPKLPTEPGLYRQMSVDYVLDSHGRWVVLWANSEPEYRTEAQMIQGVGENYIKDLKRVGA